MNVIHATGRRNSLIISALILLQLFSSRISAEPIEYSFVTGVQSDATSNVSSLFVSGTTVSGHFSYDPTAPFTGAATANSVGASVTGSQFNGAFSNLSGTAASSSFSDTVGLAVAANEGYAPSNSSNPFDLLVIESDPLYIGLSSPHTLTGFDLDGWTLINVRLFWIEGLLSASSGPLSASPDFLNGNALLETLPNFQGRLALDFIPSGYVPGDEATGPPATVFFDGLTVTPVPLPGAAWLLVSALGFLGLIRRRREHLLEVR